MSQKRPNTDDNVAPNTIAIDTIVIIIFFFLNKFFFDTFSARNVITTVVIYSMMKTLSQSILSPPPVARPSITWTTTIWDFRKRSRDWWPRRAGRCSRCLRSPSFLPASRNRRTLVVVAVAGSLGPDHDRGYRCRYRRPVRRWGKRRTLSGTTRWTTLPRYCSDHRRSCLYRKETIFINYTERVFTYFCWLYATQRGWKMWTIFLSITELVGKMPRREIVVFFSFA